MNPENFVEINEIKHSRVPIFDISTSADKKNASNNQHLPRDFSGFCIEHQTFPWDGYAGHERNIINIRDMYAMNDSSGNSIIQICKSDSTFFNAKYNEKNPNTFAKTKTAIDYFGKVYDNLNNTYPNEINNIEPITRQRIGLVNDLHSVMHNTDECNTKIIVPSEKTDCYWNAFGSRSYAVQPHTKYHAFLSRYNEFRSVLRMTEKNSTSYFSSGTELNTPITTFEDKYCRRLYNVTDIQFDFKGNLIALCNDHIQVFSPSLQFLHEFEIKQDNSARIQSTSINIIGNVLYCTIPSIYMIYAFDLRTYKCINAMFMVSEKRHRIRHYYYMKTKNHPDGTLITTLHCDIMKTDPRKPEPIVKERMWIDSASFTIDDFGNFLEIRAKHNDRNGDYYLNQNSSDYLN